MSKYYTVYVPTVKDFRRVKAKAKECGVKWEIPLEYVDIGHFLNYCTENNWVFLSVFESFVVERFNDPEFEAVTIDKLFQIWEDLKPKENVITIDGKE